MVRKASGFTLMEVVVGTLVISVGLVALLSAFLSGLLLVESGRNMAVAAADARTIFEEMRLVAGSGLPAVTSRNWNTWARGSGLNTLTNESIAVNFTNANADPLESTVTVTWQEHGNRMRTARFTSLVTRR